SWPRQDAGIARPSSPKSSRLLLTRSSVHSLGQIVGPTVRAPLAVRSRRQLIVENVGWLTCILHDCRRWDLRLRFARVYLAFRLRSKLFSFAGRGGEGRFRLKTVGLRSEGLPTAGRTECRQASWL